MVYSTRHTTAVRNCCAAVLLSALTLTTTVTPATADPATPATSGQVPGVPPALVAADPTLAEPADDPFYTPPATVPDAPGTLIRSQFAPHLLDALDIAGAPGRADKLLYTSTAQDGSTVAASGFVIEPAGQWAGNGPTPTIVFAPGTRGTGDECAPSRAPGLLAGVDREKGSVNINYEYPVFLAASAAGIRVIVTDYIGLGTPGQHTYVNHTEEGHAVLDAARAGLSLAGAPENSPVALYGYSQGGGAAAAAAELAASYAPELNIRGTFAGAPPAGLLSVADTVDGTTMGSVLGFAFNGALVRYPQLQSTVDRYFNDEGRKFLDSTRDTCTVAGGSGDDTDTTGSTAGSSGGSGGAPAATAGFDSRKFTVDGRSFSDLIRDDSSLSSVLGNDHYTLGNRTPDAPVFILNGRNDDTIPWSQSRQLAADYCAAGGTVKFVTDETPPILPGTGLGHMVPQLAKSGEAVSWIIDRFNGVEAPDNCGSF